MYTDTHTHRHIHTHTPVAHFISFFFKKETRLKTERVFASSGSLTPREAAGRPGKAASDSRLLPRIVYE